MDENFYSYDKTSEGYRVYDCEGTEFLLARECNEHQVEKLVQHLNLLYSYNPGELY